MTARPLRWDGVNHLTCWGFRRHKCFFVPRLHWNWGSCCVNHDWDTTFTTLHCFWITQAPVRMFSRLVQRTGYDFDQEENGHFAHLNATFVNFRQCTVFARWNQDSANIWLQIENTWLLFWGFYKDRFVRRVIFNTQTDLPLLISTSESKISVWRLAILLLEFPSVGWMRQTAFNWIRMRNNSWLNDPFCFITVLFYALGGGVSMLRTSQTWHMWNLTKLPLSKKVQVADMECNAVIEMTIHILSVVIIQLRDIPHEYVQEFGKLFLSEFFFLGLSSSY